MSTNLLERIETARQEFRSLEILRGRYKTQLGQLDIKRDELMARRLLLEKAEQLMRQLSRDLLEGSLRQFERLANWGLQLTRPDERYSVGFELVDYRGQLALEMRIRNDDAGGAGDALQHGGGLAQIISFLTRVFLILKLKRPKIIFLDEAFDMVSSTIQPNVGRLVREFAEKLGMIVAVITHREELLDYPHRVYVVEKEGTKSVIRLKDERPRGPDHCGPEGA